MPVPPSSKGVSPLLNCVNYNAPRPDFCFIGIMYYEETHMINIMDFGAAGDGAALNTESFRQAVAAAKSAGQAVLVPAGCFLTGTIDLQGVSLHLEPGAVIKGSPNREDYPVMPYQHNELGPLQALIVCLGGENVVIDGEGTIDLNGSSFYDFSRPLVPPSRVPFSPEQLEECTVDREWRPTQSIFFYQVKNLTLRGVTLLDAPCWTLTLAECENAKALGLTIDTNLRVPNDDGIHVCSCDGVIISGCHITSGDDCIAITGITDWAKPCQNVVVSDCVLRSCSKALVLGYIYSHVRNVLISNVIIQNSNRGLTFMCNDPGGLVENVRAVNLAINTRVRAGNWWGNGEAIFFMGVKHDSAIPPEQKPCRDTPVNFRNIIIDGAICASENAIGAVGAGSNFDNVVLRDITVEKKDSDNLALKGRTFDLAPSAQIVEVPEDAAVYLKKAGGLTLENVRPLPFHGAEQKIVIE